jgi:heterodisulfide reductase subunit D
MVKSGGNQPKEIKIMTHRPVKPRSLPTSWISKVYESATNAPLAYFPGCVFGESYKQPSIANSMISILKSLGQPFQVLTDGWCCGYPSFISGDTAWATTNAQMVSKRLMELKVKRLIVSCAWGYRMFSREYPRLLGRPLGVKVFHAAEFLHQELRAGRLHLLKPWKVVATYHDPCQLGRRCGVYDSPRELIAGIPELELVEMVENQEQSMCSGGGGGIACAYSEISNAIAMTRVKQAEDVDAQVILTACPYCRRNLQRGITSLGSKLEIVDLVEATAKSMIDEDFES